MHAVRVVCAVIYSGGKILATRRADVEGPDCWEFAGGKIEEGETSEQACRRELLEEQGLSLGVLWYLDTIEHDYPDFHLSMDVLVAPLDGARESIADDNDHRWLGRGELLDIGWLAADRRIALMLGTLWDRIFQEEHL